MVSWTTHDLLSLDWDRWSEYHGAHEVMNGAIAQVPTRSATSPAIRAGALAAIIGDCQLPARARGRPVGRQTAQWPIDPIR